MNKALLTFAGLAIALALFFGINILGNGLLRGSRIDLTRDKLYTLSPGALKVLDKLEEPVTLRFYYSRKAAGDFPQIVSYGQRVEELLTEFAARSHGKVTVEVLDPEPFSETEDRAVQYGLKGVRPPGTEDLLYFGLAGVNSTDAQEIIAFFDPSKEAFLEYDVAKLVHSLSKTHKKTIGILSTLPIEGAMPNPFMPQAQNQDPWYIVDSIRQLYDIKTIPPNATEIPAGVDVLMLVHPKNLSEGTLYAIDQYVLGGGHALVFVDPFCEADRPPQDPQNPMAAMTAPRSSDLGPLFAAWGVKLEPGKIAGDRTVAYRIRTDNRGREDSISYVPYLELGEKQFDQGNVVTSELKRIFVLSGGILEKSEGATTEFTPLIETTTDSMGIQVSSIQFQADPKTLLNEFVPGDKKLTLCAAITGNVKSAFPNGKPKPPPPDPAEPAPPEEPAAAPGLTESKEPISVIVVGDADMLQDQCWVQIQNFGTARLGFMTADNGNFVFNALDYLQGSTDLISLRGRGVSTRPFEKVDELRRSAEQRLRAEEQRLQGELDQAEQKINELLSKRQGTSTLLMTPEIEAELESARAKQLQARKNLRDVRHELNKDIEKLGTTLKIANIGVIPFLVVVLAIALWVKKNNQRRSA
jgi:ABC-type uncharacterized transport system involved in gliding motility auxiliary subunit